MSEKISAAKQSKIESVAAIKENIQKAKSVIVISYKGLTVKQDTQIRNEFRKSNVEYKVLKNTLIRRAFNELGHKSFDESLNGTTSVAFSFGDEVSAAKIVMENAKKFEGKFEAKAGFIENSYIDADGVKKLAELPSKEVLIAKMLGSFNAPITNFVGVLSATLKSLVFAVKAVHDQKEAAGNN